MRPQSAQLEHNVPRHTGLQQSPRATWRGVPIIAASGFAGLGYEIVWTRMLSLTLGTEMMAVLGVVAGFFGGLAVGAFVLDAPIRRARSPHVAFAALETVIGVWGLVSIFLLPAAGRALPPLLGTDPAPAVLWAAGFALPMLALFPATVAMGGTLTALDRMIGGGRTQTRVVAGIYGGNTAGAVAGTLATAFVLTPAAGLSGTLAVLASLNFACAAAALRFAPAPPAADAMQAEPMSGAPDTLLGASRLSATLFLTGLLGVCFEILVVRLAAQALQDTIYTFAGLLAAYLLGTAAGGLGWQFAPRHVRAVGLAGLLAATAVACLGTAWLVYPVTALAGGEPGVGVGGELALAMALLFLPAAAMGAVFSGLAQAVRDRRGSMGRAVGINSLGAAVAPLVTAQFLIPGLGAWTALLPVAFGYLVLMPRRRNALVWAALPTALAVVLWLRPPNALIRVPTGGTLVAMREGPMATASVVEDAGGVRYLEVNGHFRMGGTSSARSDYRQAMVPLLMHPAPRDALFLGLGTGATLVGGARMPGVAVHGVELSSEVAGLLSLFADPASGPPPPITIADARRYVVTDSARHDLVVADLYHPALDGSGALYTTEHFRAIRHILAPGGIFCQWLPLYQLDVRSLRTILRSFLAVYPDGSAWLNHYSVGTPMLALIGGLTPVRMDPARLAARLDVPETAAVLGPLGFSAPLDVLGLYVGGPKALAAFAGTGPLNTDDFPAVALDAPDNVRALNAPRAALLLTLIRNIHADAGELLAQGAEPSWAPRLGAYWRARNRFLEAGAALVGQPRGRALVEAASPGLLAAVRLSPEFDPAYQPLLAMARMLATEDPLAAQRLVAEIRAAAPGRDVP